VKNVTIGAAIVALLAAVVLALSMAQNDGCFPWQERVGVESSAFDGSRDATFCRNRR
jgi:hypothetical protein